MNKIITALFAGGLLASANIATAGGDADAGAQKAAACAGCHGAEGISAIPMYPSLAGQHASYLERAMADYKSGARKNPIMSGMVAALSEDDIANIAAFYAAKPSSLNHMVR